MGEVADEVGERFPELGGIDVHAVRRRVLLHIDVEDWTISVVADMKRRRDILDDLSNVHDCVV